MAAGLFGLARDHGAARSGPSVGGYLIDITSWHWIFLRERAGRHRRRRRSRSASSSSRASGAGRRRRAHRRVRDGLLAVGMPALQYVLEEGNREGWFDSCRILVLAIVAGDRARHVLRPRARDGHPVMDLRVFANRSYSAGTALNFLTGFALFSGSYLFSLFGGAVMHYSALDLGRVFLVAGTVSVVRDARHGRVLRKVDGRYLLLIGVRVASA